MQTQQLSEEDLRETLQRAREISEQPVRAAVPTSDYEAYLTAAEEMGIPREATVQALRERLLLPAESFELGQTVFAPSLDGCWYPAVIQSLEQHTATVRFLSGGDHTCAVADLRHLSLVPGRKLQADWKDWGWWDVKVTRHDTESGKIWVQDFSGDTASFSLKKVRLSRGIASPPTAEERRIRTLTHTVLLRWAALAGGAGFAAALLLHPLLRMVFPFLP